MSALRIEKVEPVGSHKSAAFVDRYDHATGGMVGGVEEVEVADYPPEVVGRAEAFRQVRIGLALSLREGAKRLGISAVQMSGLERGSLSMPDEDWNAAIDRLRAPPGPEGGTGDASREGA